MGFGEPQSKMFDQDLDDLSDGVRRASVGNVRPGPVLVVRDGVSMACMGRPFASYLCLGADTERLDRLRGPVGLPTEISFLVSPGLSWGSGEPPACGDALVFVPGRAIVVGHTQAMFRLTRRCSV